MRSFVFISCAMGVVLHSPVSCWSNDPLLAAPNSEAVENPFIGKFVVLQAKSVPRDVFADVRVASLGGSAFLILPPVVVTEGSRVVLPKHQLWFRLSALDSLHVFDSRQAAEEFAAEHRVSVRKLTEHPLPVRKQLPQPASDNARLEGKAVAVHCGKYPPSFVTDDLRIHEVGRDAFCSGDNYNKSHRIWLSLSVVDRIAVFDSMADAKRYYPQPDQRDASGVNRSTQQP
jgi:hypothetical protein